MRPVCHHHREHYSFTGRHRFLLGPVARESASVNAGAAERESGCLSARSRLASERV